MSKIFLDKMDNIPEPTMILATRSGKKLGSIPVHEIVFKDCLNTFSEVSFRVYKMHNGVECRLWNEIKDFKLIYCKQWNLWFEIRVETDDTGELVKNVIGRTICETELSQIKLYNIEINTETDIARDDYEQPTVFYNEENSDISLLNRLMEKAPHYIIKHVDASLAKIQKTYSFDDKSIYDAFQEIAEEMECIFVFGSGMVDEITGSIDGKRRIGDIERTISVYTLNTTCKSCGHKGDFKNECPKCGGTEIDYAYGIDSGVVISSENLGDKITYSVDTDSVKNCFKVEGGDELINATIRGCNPNGSDYIWHISDEVKTDMSEALKDRIDAYENMYNEYKDNTSVELSADVVDRYNNLVDKYYPPTTCDYCGYDGEFHKLCSNCGHIGALNNGVCSKCGNSEGFTDVCPTCNEEKHSKKIENPIKGYSNLMNAFYDTIDFKLYLQSSMMPSAEISETSAKTELDKLTNENLSPVAVTNLQTLSSATADSAVLAMAKTLVAIGYKVEIIDSYLSGAEWSGKFKVTNLSLSEDNTARTAESENNISVTINAKYADYVEQKVMKSLVAQKTEETDIVALFELSLGVNCAANCSECDTYCDFYKELKKYSLNRLISFNDACRAVLDILIEHGISKSGDANYQEMYQPYYFKSIAIQNEIKVREEEIEVISGKTDADGNTVTLGIQNELTIARDGIQKELDFEEYLGAELWTEFCAYRREDKYSNTNYISDGLDNAELFAKARELLEVATKEIYKSAELQHSISSTLKNLLALKEFQPLIENFDVGNWIRLIVDGEVYKLRLLEYQVDYEKLEEITVEFSDVLRVSNGYSDVRDILKQASSMASSYDSVKHQASQGSTGNKKLNNWVNNGLALTNMKIISGSDNQEIVWDNHGMLMKEYLPVTDSFSDKQLKIINKGLYVTDDGWKTSRAGIGNFIYKDPTDEWKEKEGYGVIADTLVGSMILGEKVGIYNNDNSVTITDSGMIISNEKKTGVSNPVKITMNPNDNSGVLSIERNYTDLKILYAREKLDKPNKGYSFYDASNTDDWHKVKDGLNDKYVSYSLNNGETWGEVKDIDSTLPNSLMRVSSAGELIIGDDNIVLDTDGTAYIKNIVMDGDITWKSSSNPLKVKYSANGNGTPITSPDNWHDVYRESDYFASYSYDAGKTWTTAVKIQGEDGAPGSDANIPGYIQSTYIDFEQVSSPEIRGNFVLGGEIHGGKIIGGEIIATSKNENFLKINNTALWTYKKENGEDIIHGIVLSVEDLDSGLQFYNNGTIRGYIRGVSNAIEIGAGFLTIGYSGDAPSWTNALGKWDFSAADISGLNITFG